jgi:hypothetical protein
MVFGNTHTKLPANWDVYNYFCSLSNPSGVTPTPIYDFAITKTKIINVGKLMKKQTREKRIIIHSGDT